MLNITALIPKNQNKAAIYCDKEGLQLKISLAKFYFTCQSNFIFLVFFIYFHFENKHFVKKSIRFFLKTQNLSGSIFFIMIQYLFYK